MPAELPPAIYAEAEVPGYRLPALGGRAEMVAKLAGHVYGELPPVAATVELRRVEVGVLSGEAGVRREQWTVVFRTSEGSCEFGLLLLLPSDWSRAAPVFLGLNFFGNHTVHRDPAIELTTAWCRLNPTMGVDLQNRATAGGRGAVASRWPLGEIIAAGYGLATVYCGDIAPDDPERWRDGVARLWPVTPGLSSPGTVAAWAWGLSMVREALGQHPGVDGDRVVVIGHSRLGKAALWAGAIDERFAAVISNESGCGGAALSRRRIGERLVHINTRFPHWFAPAFHAFNEHESDLPVDQHQLLAAIAPRPLYVASAEGDRWADPRGEYLSLVAAAAQWGESLPPVGPATGTSQISGPLGYHCRAGAHGLTAEDWRHYLAFADRVLTRPGVSSGR